MRARPNLRGANYKVEVLYLSGLVSELPRT
jgi:hypothetical protein